MPLFAFCFDLDRTLNGTISSTAIRKNKGGFTMDFYQHLSRRKFIRLASGAVISMSAFSFMGCGNNGNGETAANTANETATASGNNAKVFFTSDISPQGLLNVYDRIKDNLKGNIAIKLHTGEPHGPNLLPIELIQSLQSNIPSSTIVECNVLYSSPRRNTDTHRQVIETNGFTFCPVDIMDADGDINLPVPSIQERIDSGIIKNPGAHITEVPVGAHLANYDSMLVYTHFKGHAMGGFGGSLKNIGIGVASRHGKEVVHGRGWPTGKEFLERMVESGYAITNHFGSQIVYINVLKNMSVDCDCDAHGAAPVCSDIGILASTDILAIDQASIDLVYKLPPEENHDLIERIESRDGLHQLDYMAELGMGNRNYDLIQI